jgi:hypothetical protein
MTFFMVLAILSSQSAHSSGLDVQLKDLRGSFYYMLGSKEKECIKLVFQETKRLGRLTHCDPEDGHVLCKLKSGARLFAFESKESCESSLKKGVDPTPEID